MEVLLDPLDEVGIQLQRTHVARGSPELLLGEGPDFFTYGHPFIGRKDVRHLAGVQHVIDVATTAAMLDKSDQVETEHIIEAMQCRLVDRMTWVTYVSDKSILDFLATHNSKNRSKSKFDSWITTTSVP